MDQGVLQTRESPGAHEPRGRNESESEGASRAGAGSRGQAADAPPARPAGHWATRAAALGAQPERVRKDPRDGELCPSRAKPEETLVEARSGPDVQIDRQTWV